MTNFIKQLPKVELHCHLDGSIRPSTLKKIYENSSELLMLSDEELLKAVRAPEKCNNLTEYLSCFPLVTAILNTPKSLKIALMDAMEQASQENLIYQEIRFSPKHLSTSTFSMEDVVESLVKAKKELQPFYPVEVGLIACCMRGQLDSVNLEIVRLAKKYQKYGIVGIDLAGNELKYATKDYKNIFLKAESLGIPYTIHAGETGSVENIKDAIDFGAKRIGHGIALSKDKVLLEKIAKQNILLEMCPVCNIQTRASDSWKDYPVSLFKEFGVNYCFNTDNRTVSNTTITREFEEIDVHKYPVTREEVNATTLQAIDYLFVSNVKKKDLKERVKHV